VKLVLVILAVLVLVGVAAGLILSDAGTPRRRRHRKWQTTTLPAAWRPNLSLRHAWGFHRA